MIEAVRRATGSSAAVVHRRMSRGLSSLATVAATAPFFGLFGTVVGIVNSCPGCGGEKSACLAAVVELLSQSLAPTTMGLLVAVPALWCYKYLRSEIEMENASLELANQLSMLV